MVRESSRERYNGISIPVGLTKEVDEYLKSNPTLGYKSRAEFIKEAIRIHLIFANQRKNP